MLTLVLMQIQVSSNITPHLPRFSEVFIKSLRTVFELHDPEDGGTTHLQNFWNNLEVGVT
jgi:hypothetical protein